MCSLVLTRQISQEVYDCVVSFYENDGHIWCLLFFSRGKKDFVSVKSDTGRTHVQKRLILCNLKEDRVSPATYWVFQICRATPKELCSLGPEALAPCVFAPHIKM